MFAEPGTLLEMGGGVSDGVSGRFVQMRMKIHIALITAITLLPSWIVPATQVSFPGAPTPR